MSTTRYCLTCDKETQYNFDPAIHHSYCKECGNQYGIHPENPILLHFLKKLEEKEINKSDNPTLVRKLKAEINQLKLKIKLLENRR